MILLIIWIIKNITIGEKSIGQKVVGKYFLIFI